MVRDGLDEGLQEGLQDGLYEGLHQGLYEGLYEGLHEGLCEEYQMGNVAKQYLIANMRVRGSANYLLSAVEEKED